MEMGSIINAMYELYDLFVSGAAVPGQVAFDGAVDHTGHREAVLGRMSLQPCEIIGVDPECGGTAPPRALTWLGFLG